MNLLVALFAENPNVVNGGIFQIPVGNMMPMVLLAVMTAKLTHPRSQLHSVQAENPPRSRIEIRIVPTISHEIRIGNGSFACKPYFI